MFGIALIGIGYLNHSLDYNTQIKEVSASDAEDVDLNDGYFECTLIKYPKNINEYQQIVQALLTTDFKNSTNIISIKTKRLKITSNVDVAWSIDGEFGGNYKSAEINNLHEVIKIYR